MDMLPQRLSVDYHYPVYFTRSLFSKLNPVFVNAVSRLEPERCHRVLLIIDQNVARATPHLLGDIERFFQSSRASLKLLGEPLLVPGGEECKNDQAPVLELLGEVQRHRIDRQSFMAIVGGGAVLDMACFAAAIAHRGVRAVRIPTTVLSQCDSGVGVKNGINLFGKKNFIGTFVPPFAVINDIDFIDTLPARDRIAGLAEAVKVALLRDPAFFAYLELNARQLAKPGSGRLEDTIRRSAELHLNHICSSGDPFESGSARPLDFGHWAAHKLESMTRNRLRHGEAVAIGMALDLLYSTKSGYLTASTADRIMDLLQDLGLPLWDEELARRSSLGNYVVLGGLGEFQEHLGGRLHVTLLKDIGASFEVHSMDEGLVADCIQALKQRFEQRPPDRIPTALESAGGI